MEPSDGPGASGPELLRSLSTLEETERRAYQRGREAATLDATLADHDRHLNVINGRLDRLARSQETLADHVGKLTAAVFTRKQVYTGLALVATVVSAVFTATGHI